MQNVFRVIQKLVGTGRLDRLQKNSEKYEIDPAVTTVRKRAEDHWIRRMGTQFPYGLNDRIDSLPNKNSFNCEYAKFLSPKGTRKRSWGTSRNGNIDSQPICDLLVEKLVNQSINQSWTLTGSALTP